MSEAKIRLSVKEREIVADPELILTKNAILYKVKQLLTVLLEQQQLIMTAYTEALSPAIMHSSPKISRGENYQGLPYYILDHPRVFDHADRCAIRTMFWWGNFFSATLHLSGQYKKTTEQKILSSFPFLQEHGFSICIHEDEWEHHFESSNYVSLASIQQEQWQELITGRPFIKIANRIPLTNWDVAPETLLGFFEQLLMLIVPDQLPSR